MPLIQLLILAHACVPISVFVCFLTFPTYLFLPSRIGLLCFQAIGRSPETTKPYFSFFGFVLLYVNAFSALTLLVGCQEGHPARKKSD